MSELDDNLDDLETLEISEEISEYSDAYDTEQEELSEDTEEDAEEDADEQEDLDVRPEYLEAWGQLPPGRQRPMLGGFGGHLLPGAEQKRKQRLADRRKAEADRERRELAERAAAARLRWEQSQR